VGQRVNVHSVVGLVMFNGMEQPGKLGEKEVDVAMMCR